MDISHENMEIRLLCRRRFVNDADSGNTFVVDDADHRECEMLHFAQILALIVKPDGYFVLPARFFIILSSDWHILHCLCEMRTHSKFCFQLINIKNLFPEILMTKKDRVFFTVNRNCYRFLSGQCRDLRIIRPDIFG